MASEDCEPDVHRFEYADLFDTETDTEWAFCIAGANRGYVADKISEPSRTAAYVTVFDGSSRMMQKPARSKG